MTRSTAREIAVQLVFELEFQDHDAKTLVDERLTQDYFDSMKDEMELYAERPSGKQLDYIRTVVCGVQEHWLELNGLIEQYAVGWNLKRISRLAKAAMRVALFECRYVDDVPENVAIGEAVKLLKNYEDADVVGFVNGILGSYAREASKC